METLFFICLAGGFPAFICMVVCMGDVGTRLVLMPGRNGPQEIDLVHFVGDVRWLHMSSCNRGFKVSVPSRMGIVTLKAARKHARQRPRDTSTPGEHLVGGLTSGGAIETRNNNPGRRNDGGGKQGAKSAEQLGSYNQGEN